MSESSRAPRSAPAGDADEPPAPAGTVTFLFTDIESSTSLWEREPAAMPTAYARHDAILRAAVRAHGGVVYKIVGDALQAAFPTAPAAVAAALRAQAALHREPWPTSPPLRVRMALQTAAAAPQADGDYRLPALNRLGRLLAAAHGGQVVLAQATAALVRDAPPAGAGLRDLGEYPLRGLAAPERVYQLVHPDLPSDFPPLTIPERHPHNLPPPPTPLVGRDAEMAHLADLLADGAVRMLTLTGPGGVGKTRLAVATAAAAVDHFPDGAWFVDLAPLTDPSLVPAAIAQVLGLREEGGQPLAALLRTHLRQRTLLLVLDNFEHLLPAATDLPGLLRDAPGVALLVTSRARLGLRAEREVPVAPLAAPDPAPAPDPQRLAAAPAVRLFVARAQAIQHNFALTPANAPAVAAICRRLDGLPLAIELAAARSKLLAPPAMLARLDRRLPVLTGGARDLPARQRTLRDAIAWSYDLLSTGEQALFRRLAVFAGGCGLDAAAAVAGSPASGELDLDVLDGLGLLVDHSLLRQEDDASGEPRFRMLETIREYAAERLAASGEAAEAAERHARFFLALAASTSGALNGPEQALWLERFAANHDDLRAAFAWGLAHDPAAVLVATGELLRFWEIRGHLAEGRSWIERALASAPNAPAGARATALATAAVLAVHQGALDDALVLGQAGAAVARPAGELLALNRALNAAAMALHHHELFDQAEALYVEAVAVARELGDGHRIAACLCNLGEIARWRGDLALAADRYEEALAHSRRTGSDYTTAAIILNLALVARRRGDFAAADAGFREALATHHALGERLWVAYSLAGLGGLAGERGQPRRAARLLGAVEVLLGATGAVLEAPDRAAFEADVATARTALGDAAFAAAREAGQALALDDAVAEALGDRNAAGPAGGHIIPWPAPVPKDAAIRS